MHAMNRSAGRIGKWLQMIWCGDAVQKFRRVDRPHVGKRFIVAVFNAEDTDFVGLQRSIKQARFVLCEIDLQFFAGRRGD